MRAAVLFWRLGPYHSARLNAASEILDVTAVEVCEMDDVYGWDKVAGKRSFRQITLGGREPKGYYEKRKLRRKLREVLWEVKPNAVAVPGWSSIDALCALSWCSETGTPAVIMSESGEGDEMRTSWKEFVKGRAVKMCSAALAGGTRHRNYLIKLGVPESRIFLGYDAVDNDYFARRTEEIRREKARSRPERGLRQNYFLASARFVEKKNLPGLIRAYARYREIASGLKNDEIWNLVLLGDGHLRPALEAQILSLGLDGHVLLPGFKQYGDLPTYYAFAGAFVHVSIREQWGLVVNEAMASALPVLVSNQCGCTAELVREGHNGFTFDPYNVEELARLMARISKKNGADSKFGSESQRIVADWGPKRFAQGLKSAIEKAVETGTRPARAFDRLLLRGLMYR